MIEAISRLRRLFGPKARTPVNKSYRRTLAVELLESRDLLSLLPAPSSALSQYPADNPTLPASFQVYSPPVDTITIPSAAPQLATLTRQGGPDDSLAATGFQFSTLTGSGAGQDTLFQVYGQTTATNGTLRNAAIQRLNGDGAVVTLDASLPKNSMYLVWAENAAGVSLPFAVNKTEAWWIGPNPANPGKVVSVYGQNLSNGAAKPTSWIYLQPTGAPGRWITPTKVNPYKVDFVVPKDLAPGSYQIWAHNGHGGKYGWSSPVTLNVEPPYAYGNVVVKLADFAGGLPNTGVDALPAFQAALQSIGNNSGTIVLSAGNYYLSNTLNIAGGMNLGVHLRGAGKNLTFLRPLTGASFGYFMTSSRHSLISDLTINTMGATYQFTGALSVNQMSNVRVVSFGLNNVNGGGIDFAFNNCDFVGRGLQITTPAQLTLSGCNFYGTDESDSLLYVWGGNNISVTNSTVQDYQLNSPNHAHHARGRFYTGTAIWGSQSNIYIGDNKTIRFAPPKNYGDQNVGEQIMWEGSWGTHSTFLTSATATSVTLAQLANDYVGYEVVIVSGKGISQHRTVVATDFANGGTTVTVNRPWDVVPDATSQINLITIIRQAVIFRNQLQGNSNFNGASTAFETFQGGLDFVVDRNTISDFRWGLNDFSYYHPDVGPATQVSFSNLYQNNFIINCIDGIRSADAGNAVSGEDATHTANIYRRNTLKRIRHSHWYITGVTGGTMDFNVFEHNRASDASNGIFIYNSVSGGSNYLVLYKNHFDRGIAPQAGAKPIASQDGFVFVLSGNTFLNFLQPQNPKGTINSRVPVFSWNSIPGTDHYEVIVRDTTTGALVAQGTHVLTSSWIIPSVLTVGRTYHWWVRSFNTSAPISNWSVAQTFFVAPLKQPTLSSPIGTIPANNMPVLTPTFSWSSVSNADSYQIRVNNLTTGQSSVIQQTVVVTTFVAPVALLPGDRYQWMVRALRTDGNTSGWTSKSFTLGLLPPTTNGPIGPTIFARPTFEWSPVLGAHHFDVMVNDLTTGQASVLRAPLTGAGIVTTTTWTATQSLTPGHQYKWFVRAININGTPGSWSTGSAFKLDFLSAPVPETPIGTANSSGITFTWFSVYGADYYDFMLIDVTAGNAIVLRNTNNPWNSQGSPNLTAGHIYRWRVRAFSNTGNHGSWSALAEFFAT